MSYIGQTSTTLNLRINNHRSHIKHNRGKDIEIQHFQKHPFDNIKIEILDLVEDAKERLISENNNMILHKTTYPYGLNDKYNRQNLTTLKNYECIHNLFRTSGRNLDHKRGRRSFTNHPLKRYIDLKAWFNFWQDNFESLENVVNKIKNDLNFMNLQKIKQLGNLLVSDSTLSDNQLKHLVIDFCKYKLKILNNAELKLENTLFFKTFLVIPFPNKQVEKLRLKQILQTEDLKKEFPLKQTYPTLSYRLLQPLSVRVCNHRSFVEGLDLNNVDMLPCVCNEPEYRGFVNNHYGHIITGDLNILKNNTLRELFAYGSKYRFNWKLNKGKFFEQITIDIQSYISRVSFQNKTPASSFTAWRTKVLLKFKEVINNAKFHYQRGSLDISLGEFRELLKDIQLAFVIVTIDKASNNFAFICQRLYGQILKDEILNSPTFTERPENPNSIINKVINACTRYNIKVDSEATKIPFLFANPKFHKDPIRFRFITSSVNTCIRNLSIKVNKILNCLMDEIERVCQGTHESWIIKNSKAVLNVIKNINTKGNAKTIRSWDFTTLYTKIPLQLLHENLVVLFKRFLPIGCYIGPKELIGKEYFSTLLMESLELNYIRVGTQIFQQRVGIPMGSNYSTNMANLFLFYYESQHMKQTPFPLAFEFTFRYIDDLLAINNEKMSENIDTIYPVELEAEETTNPPFDVAHYLDLNLKILDSKFIASIYDKRRDFSFSILNLPMHRSNIPSYIIRNVIKSQLTRYLTICDTEGDFVFNCTLLYEKLKRNSYPRWKLKQEFSLFSKTHYLPVLNKYGKEAISIFSFVE